MQDTTEKRWDEDIFMISWHRMAMYLHIGYENWSETWAKNEQMNKNVHCRDNHANERSTNANETEYHWKCPKDERRLTCYPRMSFAEDYGLREGRNFVRSGKLEAVLNIASYVDSWIAVGPPESPPSIMHSFSRNIKMEQRHTWCKSAKGYLANQKGMWYCWKCMSLWTTYGMTEKTDRKLQENCKSSSLIILFNQIPTMIIPFDYSQQMACWLRWVRSPVVTIELSELVYCWMISLKHCEGPGSRL